MYLWNITTKYFVVLHLTVNSLQGLFPVWPCGRCSSSRDLHCLNWHACRNVVVLIWLLIQKCIYQLIQLHLKKIYKSSLIVKKSTDLLYGSTEFGWLVRQRVNVAGLIWKKRSRLSLQKWAKLLGMLVHLKKFKLIKWTTVLRSHSADFHFSLGAEVVLNVALWEETAIQVNEKLIYRWETKRFALLTSCWLSGELHLVVAFGFVAACHHMALGWWIHVQGTTMLFWQEHLPDPWKQQRPVDGTFVFAWTEITWLLLKPGSEWSELYRKHGNSMILFNIHLTMSVTGW